MVNWTASGEITYRIINILWKYSRIASLVGRAYSKPGILGNLSSRLKHDNSDDKKSFLTDASLLMQFPFPKCIKTFLLPLITPAHT